MSAVLPCKAHEQAKLRAPEFSASMGCVRVPSKLSDINGLVRHVSTWGSILFFNDGSDIGDRSQTLLQYYLYPKLPNYRSEKIF